MSSHRSRLNSKLTTLIRGAVLGAVLLVAGCYSDPLPSYGVIVETASQRELGVSTRFGIVSVGAEQDSGQVRVTAFYGDGPATDSGLIEAVGDRLCRIRVEFPTPWCEISSVLPVPGEMLTLAGYSDQDELWSRDVRLAFETDSKGVLVVPPTDVPKEWILPGTALYRWEVDRWRLVGLLVAEVERGSRRWLLAHGPIELARFVTADHQRQRPEVRPYRRDVRPR